MSIPSCLWPGLVGHTQQHHMKKAALILGSRPGSTMYIFTQVMDNAQNRLLTGEQKYKNSITILSVLNSINSEHKKKFMRCPMNTLSLEVFKVKLGGPWATQVFHRLLPSEATTKCKRLWFWLVKPSVLTKSIEKTKVWNRNFKDLSICLHISLVANIQFT